MLSDKLLSEKKGLVGRKEKGEPLFACCRAEQYSTRLGCGDPKRRLVISNTLLKEGKDPLVYLPSFLLPISHQWGSPASSVSPQSHLEQVSHAVPEELESSVFCR